MRKFGVSDAAKLSTCTPQKSFEPTGFVLALQVVDCSLALQEVEADLRQKWQRMQRHLMAEKRFGRSKVNQAQLDRVQFNAALD